MDTSLKVMNDVYASPQDDNVWNDFVEHYYPHVLRWAWRKIKDEEMVHDIVVRVFIKLRRRILSPTAKRLYPAGGESYRPYVYVCVTNAVRHFEKAKRNDRLRSLTDETVADLKAPASLAEFDCDMTIAWPELVELDARYQRAVRQLRAEGGIKDETFKCFLLVFGRDGNARGIGVANDRANGWDESRTCKYARRVARKLYRLLGLSTDKREIKTSELTLRLLVLRNGNPS